MGVRGSSRYGAPLPVEFLTDDEAAAYGLYAGSPSQADLERVFFLDDEDMDLVDQRRGEHMKVGFALQLVTVRWLGTFLDDPLDVPAAVLEFVAGQLGVADPLVANKYGERVKTLSDHQHGDPAGGGAAGLHRGPGGAGHLGGGPVVDVRGRAEGDLP